MYFDNLKKKQQDQGSKNWYYTQSFATENIKSQNKLLKQISNKTSNKNIVHQAHKDIFKFSKITF